MGYGVLDDIGMGLKFLEDGDLAHGGGGNTLIFILQLDLLHGHVILEHAVPRLEDHTIGAFSESLALLVALLDLNVHLSKEII